jgi:hypothetical protein
MGYRSQVILAVAPELMPHFLAVLAKSQPARELCFAEADETINDYIDEGSRLMKWDSIKWYDSYPCVRALIDFMDWADDQEFPTTGCDGLAEPVDALGSELYSFVEIGEDFDDVTVRGDAYWEISVNREITY